MPIRCPELCQLPRTKPGSVKSLNFRQTVPGSVDSLLGPKPSAANAQYLDRTHPAVFEWLTGRKRFPQYTSPHLSVSAYPKALLQLPDFRWPSPPFRTAEYVSWEDRLSARASDDASDQTLYSSATLRYGSLDMAFVCVTGRKLHKKAYVRKIIASRLKTATSLIITRGADARELAVVRDGQQRRRTQLQLVLDPDIRRSWILKDWVYIFRPTLQVYRLPYPELIVTVSSALDQIWKGGSRMETGWCDQSKTQTKMHGGERASDLSLKGISGEMDITNLTNMSTNSRHQASPTESHLSLNQPPQIPLSQSSMTQPNTAPTLCTASRSPCKRSSDVRQRIVFSSTRIRPTSYHSIPKGSRQPPKHSSVIHSGTSCAVVDERGPKWPRGKQLSHILQKAVAKFPISSSDSIPPRPVVPPRDDRQAVMERSRDDCGETTPTPLHDLDETNWTESSSTTAEAGDDGQISRIITTLFKKPPLFIPSSRRKSRERGT